MAACPNFYLGNTEGNIMQWILYFSCLAHIFCTSYHLFQKPVLFFLPFLYYLFYMRPAGILRESELYEKLEAVVQGHQHVIYGDPAYLL